MRALFLYLLYETRKMFGVEDNGVFYIHFERVIELVPEIEIIDFNTAPIAFKYLFENITNANVIEMYNGDFSMSAGREALKTLKGNIYYEN